RCFGTKLMQKGGLSCSGFTGYKQAFASLGCKFSCTFIWVRVMHIKKIIVICVVQNPPRE
ncbi:MAG: hypothetical protein M0P29_12890, partial [Sphaerochaetaceae bacterium]|nr:hypothetical protein [Sphaerochaetaceae bacterium]